MFPDGVYSFENGRSKFHFTTPPSNRELDKLLTSLVQRVVRFLERRGLIQRDEDQAFVSLNSAPLAMDQVQSSSITYRIALGKNKGQKALTLKTLSETNHREKPFLSKHSGFSLHAGVSTKAHQREKLKKGRQAYMVFPLVDEREKMELSSAIQEFEKLKKELPEFKLNLLHGKMKSDEKDQIMEGFRNRKFDVLVATTVIEVGVDIPMPILSGSTMPSVLDCPNSIS